MAKKRKTGNIIRNLIFVIALVVFLASAWQLFTIFMEYKKSSDEYADLAAGAEAILNDIDSGTGSGAEKGTEDKKDTPWIDFHNTMRRENEDYVGWIIVEDTKINYPIVQFSDNAYYLSHTFERTENASGALFVDCNIKEGMEGKNVIVYGHNMKNGSMFANLKKYREDDFYEGHKTFRVYTETGFYTYEVFAVYVTEPDSDTYTIGFADETDFMNYVQKMQARSIYDTGVSVKAEDKIITLSTCVNNNEDRLIVQARRLES